jgi:hypothetical protein
VKISMQEGETEDELSVSNWDIGVIGEVIDHRGEAAVAFVRRHTREVITAIYNPDSFKLSLTLPESEHSAALDIICDADDSHDALKFLKGRSILLEASTLGFVEILLFAKTLWSVQRQLSFLYVEPKGYTLIGPGTRRSYLLSKRDFELSEEVAGYIPIPGATRILSDRVKQRTVFFLGYEERRLDRALEDNQMVQPDTCSVVFGVPAFKPGWEMDAFANNIRIIAERRIQGGIHFCGAENPAAAFRVLENVRRGVGATERLFIGPIGTKPMGIGAALFATVHPEVGIFYDHPRRSKWRSNLVARWHVYNATA